VADLTPNGEQAAVAFVLDRVENPHPRMLAGALAARAESHLSAERSAYWGGYLAAMADATGCEPRDLVAWMDRHQ
jgi:hypothetical protein